jgi:cation transport regulator ChaB
VNNGDVRHRYSLDNGMHWAATRHTYRKEFAKVRDAMNTASETYRDNRVLERDDSESSEAKGQVLDTWWLKQWV